VASSAYEIKDIEKETCLSLKFDFDEIDGASDDELSHSSGASGEINLKQN
jgi:hypothetical protein